MTREFENFIKISRYGMAAGEIRASKKLSDFDLAVLFAVGKIGEQEGYPFTATPEQIYEQIKSFAPELIEV